MSCCVLSCVNDGSSGAPPVDVTFYKIPHEYYLKQLWTEAIGIPEWQLRPYSEVCSVHFREIDFTISETGERVLVDCAVPNLCTSTPNNLQAVAESKTCRVCLGMNRKMYHIRDNNLHRAYEMIMGVTVDAADHLPQMLCWECTSKLISFKTFKEKAQKSHILLIDKLAVCNILTVGDVKSINRVKHNLHSHLTLRHNEPNEFDFHISHDQTEILQEIKIECNRIKSEPPGLAVCNIELKQEDGDVKDEMNRSSSSDSDESSSGDSDDHKHCETENKRARKRPAKKEVAVTNIKRSKIEANKKKSEGVKKLRTAARGSAKPDLPNFDIRRLSLEEQLAELQARARSAAYLAAPHKCEVCYRGFRSADTLALHAVRHSERSGKFECAICKRRFGLRKAERLHAARYHAEQYSCRTCSYVTPSRRSAVDHQKWHAGNTYTCPHCPAILSKYTSYMSHLRVKHSSRFTCELCGFTFVSQLGVQMHKAKCHQLDPPVKLEGPYCEECKLRFASDEAYQRHLTQSSVHSSDTNPNRIRNDMSHPSHRPKRRGLDAAPRRRATAPARPDRPKQLVPCEQCGEQQEGYRAYARHFRVAHPGLIRTKFPCSTGNCMCEQCGKVFANKTLLLNHTASLHAGEKRFKCGACDKAFTSKTSLREHQNVHGARVPMFRCPYCEREFPNYQNCARHVKTVHKGVKQFQCEICSKEFTTAGSKRAHVDHVHHKKPRPKRVRARAPPTAHEPQLATPDK